IATMGKEEHLDNFNSTANLTKNAGFVSSISLDPKDGANNEKEYNPFEHRNLAHPNSTFGSIIHLLKACLGSGILAMPAAFKNAGTAAGIVGTLLAGFICTHAVHILVKTSQEACVNAKKPCMSFSETVGAAFKYGPKRMRHFSGFAKQLIDYSLLITYLSVLIVYAVFIGVSFKEVLDVYYPEGNFSVQVYCMLTLVPLVLICQIRNLKYLVPFSALANIMIAIVFAVTLYYMFVDLPPVSEREVVASISTWPLFLSTVIFAMEGIGVVMPVENEMANPKRFLGCPGVLNISMVIVISMYCIFGFFGYIKYGDAVKGSITLNLPQDQWVAQLAKLLMALVMYFSFALQFYVPMEGIQRLMLSNLPEKYINIVQISIRTILVSICVCVAAAFPNLELVISLVGALFFSTLGLLVPAIVDTVYNWERNLGKFYYVAIKNFIIALIGVITLVSGSYVSIVAIVEDLSSNHNDTK
ncbi:amino acid transporter, partial [Danaus plexippus plexippus]